MRFNNAKKISANDIRVKKNNKIKFMIKIMHGTFS